MLATVGIDVAARDVTLGIDPAKGGKGRSRIIVSDEVVRRDKEESMSDSRGVNVSSYHPVGIVVAKQIVPADPSGSMGYVKVPSLARRKP